MTYRPRLRTILLLINIIILLLPLGGVALLRIYENELIRQTESELIGQASLIAASFGDACKRLLTLQGRGGEGGSTQLSELQDEPEETSRQPLSVINPLHPRLELPDSLVLPPAPPPLKVNTPPDPVAAAAAKKVLPLVQEARRTLLSGCRIVDRSGIIVASSAADTGESIAAWDEVARALGGEANSQLRIRKSKSPRPALESISRGAGLRVFVAHPVTVDNRIVGAVVISRTPVDATKAIFRMRWHLAKATIAIVTVACLITIIVAYYLNRPLKKLIMQAERARSGLGFDTDSSGSPGILEFQLLSDAMSSMAATIESRSGYIRSFATAVSHEFKTPLTSLKGSLELLREHYDSMNSDERERFLAIIGGDADRLEMLVSRLLEMARAEAYTPAGGTSNLAEQLGELCRVYAVKGLKVDLGSIAADLCVAITPEVFDTIISNLLANSMLHNPPGVTAGIEAVSVISEEIGRAHV